MEQSTKQMKARAKSLVALMLAVMLMFGSSMTVLAATGDYTWTHDEHGYTQAGGIQGTTLEGGKTIGWYGSGGVTIFIDDDEKETVDQVSNAYTLP